MGKIFITIILVILTLFVFGCSAKVDNVNEDKDILENSTIAELDDSPNINSTQENLTNNKSEETTESGLEPNNENTKKEEIVKYETYIKVDKLTEFDIFGDKYLIKVRRINNESRKKFDSYTDLAIKRNWEILSPCWRPYDSDVEVNYSCINTQYSLGWSYPNSFLMSNGVNISLDMDYKSNDEIKLTFIANLSNKTNADLSREEISLLNNALSYQLQNLTSPKFSRCENIENLPNDYIQKFDNLSVTYLGYINDSNPTDLNEYSLFLSALSENIYDHGDTLIDYIKWRYGNFTSIRLVELFKIKATPETQVKCFTSLAENGNKIIINMPYYRDEIDVTVNEIRTTSGDTLYFFNGWVYQPGPRIIYIGWGEVNQTDKLNGSKSDYVAISPRQYMGKDYSYFLDIAEKQSEKGNIRNSYISYLMGLSLMTSNYIAYSDYTEDLIKKINSTKVDDLLTTRDKTEKWSLDKGDSYDVYDFTVTFHEGKLYLMIHYQRNDLFSKDRIKEESYKIAKYLYEKYPEYKDLFVGVDVVAVTDIPDGIYFYYEDEVDNYYSFSDLKDK